MEFHLRPMRWRDLPGIARWRYPNEYAIYDTSLAELAGGLLAQFIVMPSVGRVYYTVTDEHSQIVGIFSIYRRGADTVEIGLGLRPDLTGQGAGLAFVRAGMDYAREHYHPRLFRLYVLAWNQRAICVYVAAGFHVVGNLPRGLAGRVEMECDA